MTIRILVLAVAALFMAGPAHAHDFTVGALKIEHPWARATPKGAQVAGGYLKITNTGKEPDRLVGGSVAFAGRFEIHEMAMDGGVMKMRALPKGIEIKPGETIVPGNPRPPVDPAGGRSALSCRGHERTRLGRTR
jgi:copper(I)-binding protein